MKSVFFFKSILKINKHYNTIVTICHLSNYVIGNQTISIKILHIKWNESLVEKLLKVIFY